MINTIFQSLRRLYTAHDRNARIFRYALMGFDVVTVLYFIATAALPRTTVLLSIDMIIGLLILADLSVRLWISDNRFREFCRFYTIADVIVVFSFLLIPLVTDDIPLLRILLGLRLLHIYSLLRNLRRDSKFFRRHEHTVYAVVNLTVFIFITTSIVFATNFRDIQEPSAYIDALYFTVATLTTTGFGDIVLTSPGGKLLAVFIMVVGVALFFQLARAIFQPAKIEHKCSNCGLNRHDQDAIHCKHCGQSLKIETEGA